MSHVLFVLVCLIWGTSFIMMKWASPAFGVIAIGSFRLLLGAIGVIALVPMLRPKWTTAWRDAGPIIGLAIVGYALPFVLQPFVINRVDATAGHGSAFVGMMVCFVPLLTIIVSIPMLGVYPTSRQVIGVIGGLACMVYLFHAELSHGVALTDLVLGAVTPACYALSNTYVKKRFHHVSPVVLSIVIFTLAGTMLLPVTLRLETIHDGEHMPAALASLLFLGVMCTGVAGVMFYKLVQGHGPLYAGMVSYIIPSVAILLGWLDGEDIVAGQIIAMTGAFAMVALVQFGGRRGKPVAPPVVQAADAVDE